MSGGVINSMMESIDDINENSKLFTKPLLVFLAGQDKVIKNNCTKSFLLKIGTPKADMKMRLYPNSYHNIHKEPEYRFRQFAEIYEFIFERMDKAPLNFSQDDLKKLKFGRSEKRKSIKVKRSVFTIFGLTYFFYGMIILVIRALLRYKNMGKNLSYKEIM